MTTCSKCSLYCPYLGQNDVDLCFLLHITLPVAVSPLSHFVMKSLVCNDTSFLAFEKLFQSILIEVKSEGSSPWQLNHFIIFLWVTALYKEDCILEVIKVVPHVIVPKPKSEGEWVMGGISFSICETAICFASESMSQLSLSRFVRIRLVSSWWP